jgi:hypothetical protein
MIYEAIGSSADGDVKRLFALAQAMVEKSLHVGCEGGYGGMNAVIPGLCLRLPGAQPLPQRRWSSALPSMRHGNQEEADAETAVQMGGLARRVGAKKKRVQALRLSSRRLLLLRTGPCHRSQCRCATSQIF